MANLAINPRACGVNASVRPHPGYVCFDLLCLLVLLYALFPGTSFAQSPNSDQEGKKLVREICGVCHENTGQGLYRIGSMRKSPEGWELSIGRMETWHGVELGMSDYRAILKYLADKQGLAPEEAKPYRYLIERIPTYKEKLPDTKTGKVCTVCHSYGRIALQRRDEDEWRRLVHMHLGQWPHIDLHGGLRQYDWRDIALNDVPAELAKQYPLNTPAWSAWQTKMAKSGDSRSPVGEWRVWGRRLGYGDYTGVMIVRRSADGNYSIEQKLDFDRSKAVEGTGTAILYTGYEWRGSAEIGDEKIRQVFALSPDGEQLDGRWYVENHRELGATFNARRIVSDTAAIVSVMPKALRTGEEATVTIAGYGFKGKPDLGTDIKILKILVRTDQTVSMKVRVSQSAKPGLRPLSVGNVKAANKIAVYPAVSRIVVLPDASLSRIGALNGSPPKMYSQFGAIAYWNGPDGVPDTPDDIEIGQVGAKWSLEPWDEIAKKYQDKKYAGNIDQNGLFTPAEGGPNNDRILKANNTGDLRVVAVWENGKEKLRGSAHLISTVPKWVNAPLD